MEKIKLHLNKDSDGSFSRSLITFGIKGITPLLVAEILNYEYGIGVRAGSYCVYEFSRRINNTKLEEDNKIAEQVKCGITSNIPGSVRASFGMYNTIEDADRLISALKEISENGLEYYETKYTMNEQTGEWTPKSI